MYYALTLALMAFSLVAHEMGHWCLLKRFEVPIKEVWVGMGPRLASLGFLRIGMLPLGASINPEPKPFEALSAERRMWVALGGPIASVLWGVMLLIGSTYADGRPAEGLAWLGVLNCGIAVFNMIPMPPLDGFAAVAAYGESLGRPLPEWAKRLAYRVGNGVIYGAGFLCLGHALF